MGETYTLQSVVKVANVDELALQKAVVGPAKLLGALLVDKKPRTELLGLDVKETSQLLKVHGGVQLEVRLDGGAPHVGLDFVHEDGQVVLDRVDVGLGLVKVGGHGRDELRAGGAEELLEEGEGVGAALLQLEKLVAVLLAEGGVDGVVETGGVEGNADGDEGVHLVVLLCDGVVLSVLLEVLGPRDVDEDVAEHADGVGVAALHHVGETNIVVGGEVSGHDTGEHGLLVQLNVVEGLERKAEVSEKTVNPEETDDGEVSQHLIEALVAVLAGDRHGVLVALHGCQLLRDLRLLNQGVKHIKHAVAAPSVGVLAEHLDLLLVVALPCDPGAVRGKGVELVDELVDHIPGPVVLKNEGDKVSKAPSKADKDTVAEAQATLLPSRQRETNRWGLEINGALGVEDEVKQAAVGIVALEFCLEGR